MAADPLLVLGQECVGRVLAYASDIGSHSAPTAFTDAEWSRKVWGRAVDCLAVNANTTSGRAADGCPSGHLE